MKKWLFSILQYKIKEWRECHLYENTGFLLHRIPPARDSSRTGSLPRDSSRMGFPLSGILPAQDSSRTGFLPRDSSCMGFYQNGSLSKYNFRVVLGFLPHGIPPMGFLPHGIPPTWDYSRTGFLPHGIPPA